MAGEAYPTRLENLAHEAAFKLKRADEYRILASILLAECQRRVEAGDPDAQGAAWTEYCRVHFSPYLPRYIGRLIRRADAQPDHPDDEVDSPVRQDPFDRAWAAFVALDLERQQEFLRCGAAYAIHPEEAAPHPDSESCVQNVLQIESWLRRWVRWATRSVVHGAGWYSHAAMRRASFLCSRRSSMLR